MPLDIRIRFGRAIRRIREEQEIVQEEAAERCGLHRTYYSGIEREDRQRAEKKFAGSYLAGCELKKSVPRIQP
jgi:transcriptional regulator with XRE-family HTH domain